MLGLSGSSSYSRLMHVVFRHMQLSQALLAGAAKMQRTLRL
jgi:hypothetical protein